MYMEYNQLEIKIKSCVKSTIVLLVYPILYPLINAVENLFKMKMQIPWLSDLLFTLDISKLKHKST
jgi:hypothetical protein